MIDQLPCVRRQHLDVTHANCQLAKSPGVGEPHGADRHGPLGTMYGCFRNDADADVAFDQAADGIEAAQLHTQTQRSADPICLVSEKTLDRAGTVQADHVVIEHLGKADA